MASADAVRWRWGWFHPWRWAEPPLSPRDLAICPTCRLPAPRTGTTLGMQSALAHGDFAQSSHVRAKRPSGSHSIPMHRSRKAASDAGWRDRLPPHSEKSAAASIAPWGTSKMDRQFKFLAESAQVCRWGPNLPSGACNGKISSDSRDLQGGPGLRLEAQGRALIDRHPLATRWTGQSPRLRRRLPAVSAVPSGSPVKSSRQAVMQGTPDAQPHAGATG